MKYLKYIIVVILGALIALYFYNKYRVAPSFDFTKLELYSLEGARINWNENKGKKMIVSFSASWCGNCWDEMEMMNQIKDTELKGFEIIIISDESPEKVESFARRKGYPFTFWRLAVPFPSIGINAIPVTYLVNSKLEVVHEEVGVVEWNDASTVEHFKKILE